MTSEILFTSSLDVFFGYVDKSIDPNETENILELVEFFIIIWKINPENMTFLFFKHTYVVVLW